MGKEDLMIRSKGDMTALRREGPKELERPEKLKRSVKGERKEGWHKMRLGT